MRGGAQALAHTVAGLARQIRGAPARRGGPSDAALADGHYAAALAADPGNAQARCGAVSLALLRRDLHGARRHLALLPPAARDAGRALALLAAKAPPAARRPPPAARRPPPARADATAARGRAVRAQQHRT